MQEGDRIRKEPHHQHSQAQMYALNIRAVQSRNEYLATWIEQENSLCGSVGRMASMRPQGGR